VTRKFKLSWPVSPCPIRARSTFGSAFPATLDKWRTAVALLSPLIHSDRAVPHKAPAALLMGAAALVLAGCQGVACQDTRAVAASQTNAQVSAPNELENTKLVRVASTARLKSYVIAPAQLVGLSEAEIQNLMGRPSLMDDRPPAKTWRYLRGGCTLTLALYPDVETRIFRALTYEVTSDDPANATDKHCRVQFSAAKR